MLSLRARLVMFLTCCSFYCYSEPVKNLTLVTMKKGDKETLGVKTDKGILDVESANKALNQSVPTDVMAIIKKGDQSLKNLVDEALKSNNASLFKNEAEITFGPSVTNPGKIICVIVNNKAHAAGLAKNVYGKPPTPSPLKIPAGNYFSKFSNTVNSHKGTIEVSKYMPERFRFDHEIELVVVMGKKGFKIPESEALNHVYGYTIGNDFSERSIGVEFFNMPPVAHKQLTLFKTLDGFAPMGPYLVSADQVSNPNDLKMELFVNGEKKQSDTTANYTINIQKVIADLSGIMTLEPGDVIFMGTPAGTIYDSQPFDKAVWLKPGDHIRSTIEGLGVLEFDLK